MRRTSMLAFALLVSAARLSAADVPVYVDALGSGWQNWSWDLSGTPAQYLANAEPHHGASGTSIKVTYASAWAGLYLHSTQSFSAADYQSLRFSIHGGSTGGQKLTVTAYASGASGQTVPVNPPAPNGWTDVEVPISSFHTDSFSELVWQSTVNGPQPSFYLDDIKLIATTSPPDPLPVTLTIDATASVHPINPLIYGMNFASADLAAELGLPANRWGGNSTTRYNWQNDISNRASDWYFENIPEPNANPGQLPDGSATDRFVEGNLARGSDSIITVPLIGWTPKSPRTITCGFSVAKYGPQQQTDPYRSDCGNGKHTDGTPITNNDPTDTSMAIDGTFVSAWVTHLVSRYGTADAGGVRFYNLDNEPMLWNSTHRDVHPAGTSYDELRDRTYHYAAAVKAADPGALTLGPVLWGWTAYFYSGLDAAAGGSWWNNPQDRLAHGNVPFVEWYLQQMKTYEVAHGQRILDYLDLHFYPQAEGVALGSAGDSATQARRLRSTRALWDPSYNDESWINDKVRLIPRMKEWVNNHYSGTRTAITEYNWGGLESMNGALAQADVLGIFGREGLDLATLWDPPSSSEPGAFAFRMYRNYDGAGGRFGETSIQSVSSDQARTAVYAALRADGALTAVMVNKATSPVKVTLVLTNYVPAPKAAVYRYSSADLGHIQREADASVNGTNPKLTLPASSITLLVASAYPFAAADFDHDTDVDTADLQHFAGCRQGPELPVGAGCRDADLDGDEDVDQADFGLFQRCLSGNGVPVSAGCAR